MQLVCPHCHAKLTVPDQTIPDKGAWGRCPKCHDRFFIPASNQKPDLAGSYQPVRQAKQYGAADKQSLERQRLLERLKTLNGENDAEELPDFDPSLITVYPELQQAPRLRMFFCVLFLIIPVIFTIVFFSISSKIPLEDPRSPTDSSSLYIPDIDPKAVIRGDLLSLRQKMMRRGRFSSGVNYTGPESRVFNYYMEQLVPGLCTQGISYIEIKSLSASTGFSATATCLEHFDKKIEMKVHWPGRKATISFPGLTHNEAEVELFPEPAAKQ